jgi:prepilin-type N-terminal cleavage/methylation domain-containing protein
MMTKRTSGFTLVELLVAMAVFAIVISVATGAFIRALRTQRQLTSFAAANSNVSLMLEQMAREIRVGSSFSQTDPTRITFTNGRGEQVTYSYDSERKAVARAIDAQPAQMLTSENVDVRNLEFQLQFADPHDGYPARITIVTAVSPKEQGVDTSVIRIQTTVSARSLGT